MHRTTLILLVLFTVACVGYAQSSSGGSSAGSTATAPSGSTNPGARTAAPGANSGTTVNSSANTGATTGSNAGTAQGVNPVTSTGTTTPSTGPTQTPMAPATTGGEQIAPGSATNVGGNANTTAPANTGAVIGTGVAAPGAVSPEIHFETVMPPPGVTSNQPGAPAGVSSFQTNTGTPSAPNTFSIGVQSNAVQPTRNPNANVEGATFIDLNGKTFGGAVDLSNAQGGNMAANTAADNRSLAEIAAQYKRGRATQNARVITNEDIARLNARSDVNVMGAQDNAALPQGEEAAPADQQQQPQAQPKPQKRSPFAPKSPK